MHRVSDAVCEVDEAEECDKLPALEFGIERQVDNDGCRHNADQKPGFELAPLRSRLFDDVAHDRIVQRVEDPGCDHDGADRQELFLRQLFREHDVCQDAVIEQEIHHVPADSAERVEDQVFLSFSAFLLRDRLSRSVYIVFDRSLLEVIHKNFALLQVIAGRDRKDPAFRSRPFAVYIIVYMKGKKPPYSCFCAGNSRGSASA